jgi:hypothetical protein
MPARAAEVLVLADRVRGAQQRLASRFLPTRFKARAGADPRGPQLIYFSQLLAKLEENAMNAKLTSFAIGAALLGSTSAFAGPLFGRDSVYATPGASTGTLSKAVTATTRASRGSVYAYDLPAPTPKGQLKITVIFKPGRA